MGVGGDIGQGPVQSVTHSRQPCGLDAQRLLEGVWLRERFTAILVTHDVAEAIALADRIVLIEQGALALDVTVDLPRPRLRGSAEAEARPKALREGLDGRVGQRRPVA